MKDKKITDILCKKSDIIITIVVIVLAILAILPIFIMARYNVPAADDYSYSVTTHRVWEETHNVFLVLKAAGEKIASTYNEWQGTFSAVFLFALQPSIWGVNFYGLSTLILVFALLISNLYLIKTMAKKIFNYEKKLLVIILSLVTTIVAIEFVPDSRESLFWWNGASYYTLFYSIMLITIGVIIRLITSEDKKKNIINTIISIILSIIIGGGNYPTALMFIIISVLITFILFVLKNNKKWNMLAISIVSIISLGISMIAPGNAVRQNLCDDSLGAVGSIIKAIYEGAYYVIEWTNIPIILMFVFLIPFIYEIIKNANYKFRYPLIFTIITFGIFSAQFVPPLYAMNNLGGSRLIDIIYYSFYWLIGLNIMYYLGWMKNKFGDIKLIEYINNNKLVFSIIIAVLFTATIIISKSYQNLTSYISFNSILSGEAQEYYSQILDRYKIYEDENIKDVVVKEITVKPTQIYGSDITEDKDNWINTDAAKYFNKNSIILEKR